MLKERAAVAQNVADHLFAAERQADLALVATAKLVASMLEGRLAIDAAAEVGQDAFEAVAATFADQSASRKQLVTAHKALLQTKRQVGLEAVALGGSGDKQVPTKPTGALTLVESVAA
jgi:hypothetical protein